MTFVPLYQVAGGAHLFFRSAFPRTQLLQQGLQNGERFMRRVGQFVQRLTSRVCLVYLECRAATISVAAVENSGGATSMVWIGVVMAPAEEQAAMAATEIAAAAKTSQALARLGMPLASFSLVISLQPVMVLVGRA